MPALKVDRREGLINRQKSHLMRTSFDVSPRYLRPTNLSSFCDPKKIRELELGKRRLKGEKPVSDSAPLG